MNETILSIAKWHEETFPDATLEGQLAKYRDEESEWIASDYKDLNELADMFIVACGVARFDMYESSYLLADVLDWLADEGISFDKLKSFIETKMKTNRQRKWAISNGKYQHVEE